MSGLVLVTGLGRCGSSLTMQMLAAGGLPCVGQLPSFEVMESLPWSISPDWLRAQRGALKLLDPQLHNPTLFLIPDLKIVFLTRDPVQQARSSAKFMLWGGAIAAALSRKDIGRIASSLRRDTRTARAVLARSRAPMLEVSFEHLVRQPATVAEQFAAFLRPVGDLDVARMAAAYIDRGSRPGDCLPHVLEQQMAEGAPSSA